VRGQHQVPWPHLRSGSKRRKKVAPKANFFRRRRSWCSRHCSRRSQGYTIAAVVIGGGEGGGGEGGGGEGGGGGGGEGGGSAVRNRLGQPIIAAVVVGGGEGGGGEAGGVEGGGGEGGGSIVRKRLG